jgi:hypothetical protein
VGASLVGANLVGANLTGANLTGANNLPDFTMPDGMKFSQYKREVVPALLAAGGKSLEDIRAAGAWECHSWKNCPMAIAFGVNGIENVPPLYRARAKEFVQLFDAKLLPAPWEPERPAQEADPAT